MTTKTTKSAPLRHLKWLLPLLLIIAGIATYRHFNSQPDAPEYLTATVEIGDIENTVMASGKIKAIETVDVGAQVSGEITQLYVNVGDVVKKGDLIAQISQVEQKNIVANAQATLLQANASLDQARGELASRQGDVLAAAANVEMKKAELAKAQSNFDRLKGLIEIHAISQEEYDNARTAVDLAKSALKSAQISQQNAQNQVANAKLAISERQASINKAQNDMATAQEDLRHTTIRAPMDGTVVAVVQKQGTTVNANQSAPTIVTLADLSRVRINAQISEADVVKVRAGMPAKFSIIGNPEEKYNATLSGIEPAPENISTSTNTDSAVYYIGYLDVDNADGTFRIDMTAQVQIIIDEARGIISVPAAAINTKDGKSTVRILQNGEVKSVPVTLGITNRIHTQITSGLSAGDTIILGESGGAEAKGSSDKGRNRPPMF